MDFTKIPALLYAVFIAAIIGLIAVVYTQTRKQMGWRASIISLPGALNAYLNPPRNDIVQITQMYEIWGRLRDAALKDTGPGRKHALDDAALLRARAKVRYGRMNRDERAGLPVNVKLWLRDDEETGK